MTPESIFLVQSSFDKLVPDAELFAATFYARLFELDPRLRGMFRGDLAEQGRKLMQMLTVVVRGLDRLPTLLPAVHALGARHAGYGVTSADYDRVGAALIWTLQRMLGPRCTIGVALAWANAYAVLAEQMIAGSALDLQERVA
jgi:hemoglobin-like flavoprotein